MKKMIIVFSSICLMMSSCKKEEITPTPTPIISYSNFKITSIKLTEMSFLNANSSGWDNASGPDVFFELTDVSSNLQRTGGQIDDISTSSLPLAWNFSTAFEINNLSANYYLNFYDHDDLDPDDYIGWVGLKMDSHKDKYPTSISLNQNGIKVTISGVWY